jgi:hypothetical protein
MSDQTTNASNRARVIAELRAELVGPAPAGRPIDVQGDVRFNDYSEARGPFVQLGTGDEILVRDTPIKRYGVGVLFPLEQAVEDTASRDLDEMDRLSSTDAEAVAEELPDLKAGPTERETDDFDLSTANAYQPSALGLSFLVELLPRSKLVVEATGGRYTPKLVSIGSAESAGLPRERSVRARNSTWWLRRSVTLTSAFGAELLTGGGARPVKVVASTARAGQGLTEFVATNVEGLNLSVEAFARPYQGSPDKRLVTVTLLNRSASSRRGPSEKCLFQAGFRAWIEADNGLIAGILPYPSSLDRPSDAEEQGLDLLYRSAQTFATGHGCAANWKPSRDDERAEWVSAETLPVVETPNTTPEIRRSDGSTVSVKMAALAGLLADDDGDSAIKEIIDRYKEWTAARRVQLATLPSKYQEAGQNHVAECERAARRMEDGLAYLRTNRTARRAFQLANQAVLLQQIVSREEARRARYDAKAQQVGFTEPALTPDPLSPPRGRGTWRPFQIAFLMAAVRSTAEGNGPDRKAVELIWFPTGGGKTEAYLGLAAFAMFKRRLDDPFDAGVSVLMRYTLRLLTAQQFQRACGLLCAMEYLRRTGSDALGDAPFAAGIWLGGDTTPNTRVEALNALTKLRGGGRAENPFLLGLCPWCGAQFGRVERQGRGRGPGTSVVLGYKKAGGTVTFECPDAACFFRNGLPIHVVDEDIYENRPTFVIGTIDKFAMLAWRPEARSLFGLDADGNRVTSPPGLIIQDELHLIAGPLGSLAGLYETVVEELCTDRRTKPAVSPKIVSSTATIRRYKEQIRGLYARDEVHLFPPPGLDAANSFFARYDSGPGRLFVGVHAVSLGSVQTEWVRTFAAVMQAPMSLPEQERDPWWTMLVFFNSLREMGTAHTLLQSDIPDYAKVIWDRAGTDPSERRRPGSANVFELTGGLQSEEISRAIADLQVPFGGGRPIDVCLASNVIEVGIDIPRLALMVVAGQPKTTAQYIQVTGRVGRTADRPGLVVTMYSPSKPRDRSHFERFRSYHQRLYAHVEPTSVTPFSSPALDRALHAVLVSFVRQVGGKDPASRPSPFPASIVERFRPLILGRAQAVDPAERSTASDVLNRRLEEWQRWKRTSWTRDKEEVGQLRVAGQYATSEERRLSWATPMSMRNVDAECQVDITTAYIATQDEGDDA